MACSLFSEFDPYSSAAIKLNWFVCLIAPVLVAASSTLLSPSRSSSSGGQFRTWLLKIFSPSAAASPFSVLVFIVVLYFVLGVNVSGLLPYSFPASSQVSFTAPLAVVMWASVVCFGLTRDPRGVLARLVPQNISVLLAPLMSMVELVSVLVRPFTLSLRLAANIVAGHLLLTLVALFMGGANSAAIILGAPFVLVLTVLELAVSGIQAYVFAMLIALYSSES